MLPPPGQLWQERVPSKLCPAHTPTHPLFASDPPVRGLLRYEHWLRRLVQEYSPAKLPYGRIHPDPVVETSSLSAVPPPDITYELAGELPLVCGSLEELKERLPGRCCAGILARCCAIWLN